MNAPTTSTAGIEPEAPRDPERPPPNAAVKVVTTAIDGVEWLPLQTRLDERGSLLAVADDHLPFWDAGLVYSYVSTLAVRAIKGFATHATQVDRATCVHGSVRFVLFDGRLASSTRAVTWMVDSHAESRGALRIPAGVWLAVQNLGATEALVLNHPTTRFQSAEPDTYRVAWDSGKIAVDPSAFA